MTQEKICKKIFFTGPSSARGLSLKGARITFSKRLSTSTGRSSSDIAMKACRHIALGEEQVLKKKNLGVGPPGGNFYPNFFSRFRSENLRESWLLPRKNYAKKIFTIAAIGAELQRLTYGVQRVGVGYAVRRRLCRRTIRHVTVTSK